MQTGVAQPADHHRYDFEKWLKKAREVTGSDSERELLNNIESRYIRDTICASR